MPLDINQDFIDCYTLGHKWENWQDPEWRIEAEQLVMGQPVSFVCVACGTTRREFWSRTTGTVQGRSYNYPDGYSIENIQDMIGEMSRREAMRVEYLDVKGIGETRRSPRRRNAEG